MRWLHMTDVIPSHILTVDHQHQTRSDECIWSMHTQYIACARPRQQHRQTARRIPLLSVVTIASLLSFIVHWMLIRFVMLLWWYSMKLVKNIQNTIAIAIKIGQNITPMEFSAVVQQPHWWGPRQHTRTHKEEAARIGCWCRQSCNVDLKTTQSWNQN